MPLPPSSPPVLMPAALGPLMCMMFLIPHLTSPDGVPLPVKQLHPDLSNVERRLYNSLEEELCATTMKRTWKLSSPPVGLSNTAPTAAFLSVAPRVVKTR